MVKLALLMLAQVVYSAAYITYFSYSFNYGKRLIALHVCVMLALIAAATLASGVAFRLWPRSSRIAVAVVSAFAFGFITVLYGVNLLSAGAWGHNITLDIALRYLLRPAVLLRYLMTVTSWQLPALLGVVVAAGMVYLARSRIVANALQWLDGPRATFGARRLAAVALVTAAVIPALAAGLLVYAAPAGNRPVLLAREPVIGFFVDTTSAHRLALSTFAAVHREEGPRVRATYPADQPFERRNVILILVDSLRADHLPIYGYPRPTTPFLEGLRQDGRLRHVRLAMATCPESNCGVSSVLASKTFGSLVPENFALHELFFDRGYDVNFILSGDHDWYGMREFYGDDITMFWDGKTSEDYEPTDDRVVLEGLNRVPPFTGRPAFFYFHLMSAHVLGYHQERYQRFRPAINLGDIVRLSDVDLPTHINSYDNGVVQADGIIGELFDALDQKDYLSNALVVISSDHGEGLGEHDGMRGHSFQGSLYQEFLAIPLLIYDEPAADYQNLQFATQVDIAPTIASRLGLPVPSSWEGKSLLEPGIRTFSYHYMDTHDIQLYALMHPVDAALYKYFVGSGREELFELTTDPGERTDVMASADPAVVRRLRSRLADLLATTEQ
jgi:glucan phosphoethanolaminetransferase (alkaline phosphatase superfamily)